MSFLFTVVLSPGRSLRTVYCSFGSHLEGYRTPCSTDGRDLPIYTAGLTGAMRATATATDGAGHRTWDLAIARPMLKPQCCS